MKKTVRKTPSLKLNAVMNALLTVSKVIFPIISFPYVSRILSPVGIGKVSFATSVISYFAMFAQLGIPVYGIRETARVRDDKEKLAVTVKELFFINLLLSILAYVVFFVLLYAVPKFAQEKPLLIVSSLTIIFNCIGMEWLYQGLEKYSYITIRSVVFKAISIIGMFLLIRKSDDYIIYAALVIFAGSASNVLNFLNLHKIVEIEAVRGYILDLRRHMKPVMVFFAMSCATTVYLNLDTVMLGFMKSDEEVGYYNAAVKVKSVLTSVVTSLGAVLLPRSSYYVEHGENEEFLRISRKAMNFVVLVATPLTLYFMMYAKESILLLSGKDFSKAVMPMIAIMPTVLLIGMSGITGYQILMPIGKEKTILYSEIAGATVDCLVNAALIPKFSSVGAAIGTVMAEFIVWLVQYCILQKNIDDIYGDVKFDKVFCAIIVATVACCWVKWLALNAFLILVISFSIFAITYSLMLIITKEPLTIELYKQLIARLSKGKSK